MSIEACSDLLQRGDPDRFLAVMTGKPAARAALLPLYALNLELARASGASQEPLIGAMRLQFWRDQLTDIYAGKMTYKHEVTAPLADVIHAANLPAALFKQMIDGWQATLENPSPDAQSLTRHTSGTLMVLAGLALGAGPDDEKQLCALGHAAGLANWLMALPALSTAQSGFSPPRPEEIRRLAHFGAGQLSKARQAQPLRQRQLYPALRTAWRAKPILARAIKDPEAALNGTLVESEFSRRFSLLWLTMRGRW